MGRDVFLCIFVKRCFAFSIYEVQSPKQSQLMTLTGSHLSNPSRTQQNASSRSMESVASLQQEGRVQHGVCFLYLPLKGGTH